MCIYFHKLISTFSFKTNTNITEFFNLIKRVVALGTSIAVSSTLTLADWWTQNIKRQLRFRFRIIVVIGGGAAHNSAHTHTNRMDVSRTIEYVSSEVSNIFHSLASLPSNQITISPRERESDTTLRYCLHVHRMRCDGEGKIEFINQPFSCVCVCALSIFTLQLTNYANFYLQLSVGRLKDEWRSPWCVREKHASWSWMSLSRKLSLLSSFRLLLLYSRCTILKSRSDEKFINRRAIKIGRARKEREGPGCLHTKNALA